MKKIKIYTFIFSVSFIFLYKINARGFSQPILTNVRFDTTKTRLAPFFQAHMVLQAEQPINIWGTASPEAQFEVSFGSNIQKAIADMNGNWKVTFPSIKASFIPFQLKVNNIVLEDILIGELWICSGQSNMGSSLVGAEGGEAIYKTSNPNALRLLRYTGLPLISKQGYTEAELQRSNTVDFFEGKWTINDKVSAEQFSSVAWMFGKKLSDELNVPIGLILMALGGSAINSWISPQTLKADSDLATYFTKDWLTNEDVSSENRDRGKEALQNHLPAKSEPYLVGKTPYRWLCESGFLFEAGIEPLKNLNFKGVIWYQGEADAVSSNLISRYKKQFPLMVKDWRAFFNQGNFPFIYVQLPSYQEPLWTEFREVQRNSLNQIPNSFMAITFDLGDEKDIHPKDKLPVGERISFLALNNVYKTPNKKPSFPEVKSIKKKKNGLIIQFNQAISSGIFEELSGFEIANQDGKFVITKAKSISKTEISVETSSNVKSIRYGWTSNFKPIAKIFNKNGLPLGAFVWDIK
jgi:sialate O-acetylesterase